MKKALVCMMLLSIAAVPVTQASNVEVPSVVKKVFYEKFPNAEDVSWNKVNTFFVAAFFHDDGNFKRVSFAKNGQWKMTETEIDESDLPDVILDAVSKNYESAEYFESIFLVENPSASYYSINLETEDGLIVLQFNESGELIED